MPAMLPANLFCDIITIFGTVVRSWTRRCVMSSHSFGNRGNEAYEHVGTRLRRYPWVGVMSDGFLQCLISSSTVRFFEDK